MPKVMSYAVVGVVAFLVGGFSFLFISHVDDEKTNTATFREFVIEGMSCQGCADTITSALTKISGVQSAKVSLQDKRAVVTASESQVPTEKILTAISTAGYKGQLASEARKTPATAASSTKQPPHSDAYEKDKAADPVAAEFPYQYFPENLPDPRLASYFPQTWSTYAANQGRNAVFALPGDAPQLLLKGVNWKFAGAAPFPWMTPR